MTFNPKLDHLLEWLTELKQQQNTDSYKLLQRILRDTNEQTAT